MFGTSYIMAPDSFEINVDEILNKLPESERKEFEKGVNDYMRDTSRLREYGLPVNPNRETVRQALCKEMYCQTKKI